MSADYFYDAGVLLDDTTYQPQRNVTGYFTNADGQHLAMYDQIGTPIEHLVTNHLGYIVRFRADVPNGYLDFGGLRTPVTATNLGLLVPAFALASQGARPVVPEGTRLVIIANPGGGGLGPQVPSWAKPGDVVVAGIVVGGALS